MTRGRGRRRSPVGVLREMPGGPRGWLYGAAVLLLCGFGVLIWVGLQDSRGDRLSTTSNAPHSDRTSEGGSALKGSPGSAGISDSQEGKMLPETEPTIGLGSGPSARTPWGGTLTCDVGMHIVEATAAIADEGFGPSELSGGEVLDLALSHLRKLTPGLQIATSVSAEAQAGGSSIMIVAASDATSVDPLTDADAWGSFIATGNRVIPMSTTHCRT